jgi:hypothetical protein
MLEHVSPTVGSVLWRNGKVYPVQFGTIDVSTANTTALVPSPGVGKSVVLLELFAWIANGQTFRLQDTVGAPILPAITAGAGGLIVNLAPSQYSWRKLPPNAGLSLVTTAAAVAAGMYSWIEVDE